MSRLQTNLQQALNRIDPWLDACFPVATALICARQRLIAYSLLTLFVVLRLLQRSDKQGWRWILLSLVVLNAGLVIEDRDLKPGSASDYLIIAAGFAAGFQRTPDQWRNSLPWLASCILPVLAFTLVEGNPLIERAKSFTGFNINKLGFLAGLLIVLAYGWLRQAQHHWTRLAALALVALGAWEAVLTQSRAAIAVPILAIAVDLASRIQWNPRRWIVATCLMLTLTGATAYQWYFRSPAQHHVSIENQLSDINRARTVECWFASTLQSQRGLWLGLGYGKPGQDQCGPNVIPSLRAVDKSKGFQHAHNLYTQVFTESGIGALLLLAGLTVAGFKRCWQQRLSRETNFTLPLFVYLFLMAIGITYWQVLLVNQILVGYTLAALSTAKISASPADRVAAGEPTPATPPP